MKLVAFSPLLLHLAQANVYLHSPRGSNNRLNENSAQNKEPTRLFNSNNNRRGGYNVGDRTNQAAQQESDQYAMRYFADSLLTVEWTNLVGCGEDEDGDKINNCKIVLQSMCQSDSEIAADSFTLRNGKNTARIPYNRNPASLNDPAGRCFIDSHNRDLSHTVNNRVPNIPDGQPSSIEWCRNTCHNLGYLYAGLQYSRECFCGNEYGRYGEAPLEQCNRNCVDQSNGQNKCGGSWRQNIYLAGEHSNTTETRQEKNDRRAASMNQDFGLHEPWEFYDRCENGISTRYGMECAQERETWPAQSMSPWTDVALFTDDLSECSGNTVEHINHHEFFECVEYYDAGKTLRKHKSEHRDQTACEATGGDWLGFYKVGDILEGIDETKCGELASNANGKHIVWGRPMNWAELADDKLSDSACIILPPTTQCLPVPSTRSGYLGNTDFERTTPRFQWRLPTYEENKRCIFRIRYIVSTPKGDSITTEDNVVHIQGSPLSLATAHEQIVYEDRSHVFEIWQRPASLPDSLTIHNLVVRGKRGNIVQTFPAVEYDFVPNRLTIPQGDAIHIQWTGSNTHNNAHPAGDGQAGDAGEGQRGTDRNNFIQLVDRQANLVAPHHNHTLVQGAQWVWSSHEQGDPANKDFNLALALATSGYYHCKDAAECDRNFDNSLQDQLNNAAASFAGEIFVPSQGEFHYKCMRNDNFSNRAQKGTILVL